MRLREPAAWIALAALALNLVVALVGLATFNGPLVSMGWMWSERVADPTSLLALAVLVGFCVLLERTPHARQLTIISLVVGVIAVLLGLTLALLGIAATAPILAVLAAIVPQAISIIAVGLLIKLLQLQAVPRRLPPGIGLVLPEHLHSGLDQEHADLSPSSPAPPAPDQRLQPSWHPDMAASPAWQPAVVDAAAGAPATGWGEAQLAQWHGPPTATNGSRPDGWMPGDSASHATVPMPDRQALGRPGDPWEAPTVRWHAIPTPTNGSRPDGWMPGDSASHATVPMPEQQASGRPGDPWADQEQRNSQPLALDWGSPQP
jgi:hypothetical protein